MDKWLKIFWITKQFSQFNRIFSFSVWSTDYILLTVMFIQKREIQRTYISASFSVIDHFLKYTPAYFALASYLSYFKTIDHKRTSVSADS